MRGIYLNDSIRVFGFKDGINFWFDWCIWFPIKNFYWSFLSNKKWCCMYGWYCKEKNCKYKHYDKPMHINENEDYKNLLREDLK